MFVPSLKLVIERPSATMPPVSSGPVYHVYSNFVGVSSRQRSKRSPSERVEWSLATKESQTHHQQSQRPCQLKAAQIRSHLDFRDRLTLWIVSGCCSMSRFLSSKGSFWMSWNIIVTAKRFFEKGTYPNSETACDISIRAWGIIRHSEAMTKDILSADL